MNKNKKLILVVDDNSENRKVLGNLLSNNGYEVGVASDGFKALKFIENVIPDLILLDVMMPGMDGFEVCQKIKENQALKYIPIIFLTAKTSTEDIVKGFKVGGVDYVSKPFSGEELLARVNTHIELKTLRGFLPICSRCKKIRDDDGYWHSVEEYISEHSDVQFSHGLCKTCADELYGDEEWYKKDNDSED